MRLASLLLAILMAKVMVISVEATYPPSQPRSYPGTHPHQLDCYSGDGLEGEMISLAKSIKNMKNATEHGQDFKSTTIFSCLVTGIWLVYEKPEFQGKLNGISGENKAFTPSLGGRISSVRKIGNQDRYSNEVVLFEATQFQGSETWTLWGLRQILKKVIKSAIVKGYWDWTIVGTDDSSYCLKANKNAAAFFSEINGDKGLEIKWVKQGCMGRVLEGKDQILGMSRSACNCNSDGVLGGDKRCWGPKAICTCDTDKHFTGDNCDKCIYGFFKKNKKCENCKCNIYGVENDATSCDESGQCKCNDTKGYTGMKCDQCLKKFYQVGYKCEDCGCDKSGMDGTCDKDGDCICMDTYYKDALSGDCKACNCAKAGMTGNCDDPSKCECKPYHEGANCDTCPAGSYKDANGACIKCDFDASKVCGVDEKLIAKCKSSPSSEITECHLCCNAALASGCADSKQGSGECPARAGVAALSG